MSTNIFKQIFMDDDIVFIYVELLFKCMCLNVMSLLLPLH